MSVSFWMNEIYENRHENEMVRDFCGIMQEAFGQADVPIHVVLNFKLPAVDRDGLPRGYLLSPDAMVVRPDGFLLIDFKHYSVPVTGHLNAYSCPWTANTPREGVVEVHGGSGKRTPLGQLRDYRRALIRVLMPWLDECGICADPEKMVSAAVVFSNAPAAEDNTIDLQGSSSAWCSAVRLRAVPHVAGGICELAAMMASGRHRLPDAHDLPAMIERLFRGRPAVLVEGMPLPSVAGTLGATSGADAEPLAGYSEVCRALAKAMNFVGRPRLRCVDAAADPSDRLVQICRPHRARLFVWQDTPQLPGPILEALRRRFSDSAPEQALFDRVLYTYWSEGELLLPGRLTAILATLPESLQAQGGPKMRMMALADRLQPAVELICREVSPDVRIGKISQRINWLCAEKQLPEGMRRMLLHLFAAPYREASAFREHQLPAALKAACAFLEAFGGTLPAELSKDLASVTYPSEPERSAADRYPSLRVIFREADLVNRRYRVSEWMPGSGVGASFWVELHDPAKEHVQEDESYLLRRGRLRNGDVLSLVTPYRRKDRPDTMIASAVVLEPDFLFTPSQLGQAVRSRDYAGPVRFLNRFAVFPATVTAHMMRGNVANAILSELLMHPEMPPDGPSVAEQYRRTHCEEALRAGDRLPSAMDDGRLVQIAAQLSERIGGLARPSEVASVRVPEEDWLQEVPFVSPELGFQGRMDLFAPPGANHPAMVVELKASKPTYVCGRMVTKPEHAFQPSLYGELLFHTLQAPRDRTRAMVLYVGDKPFMKQETGTADSLRSALRCRNLDFIFLRNICEGRLEAMLEHIQPSDLRGDITEREWYEFGQEDRMAALLKMLRPEDPVVRAYLHMAVRFLCQEEMLARLGTGGQGDIADTWLLPFDERSRSGLLLDGLREDPSARTVLRTQTSMMTATAFVWDRGEMGDRNAGANFRDGDVVWMYRRSVDLTKNRIDRALLTAGVITRIEAGRVAVAFDMPQRTELCSSGVWVAEHAPIVGGNSGCWRGLREFLTGVSSRRDLLLGRASLTSAASEEALRALDQCADNPLDVVAAAVRQTDDLFLLWGPPGTGKTSHAIRRFLLDALAEGESVLLLAYTNKAVDNLCGLLDRLCAEEAVAGGLSYFRIASTAYHGAYRDRCLVNMPFRSAAEAQAELKAVRVVVGTVSSVSPDHPVFGVNRFSLALVDEAAQLLEPQILSLFCASDREDSAVPLVRRWVFIGDHCQLPAVVQQPGELAQVPESSPLRDCGIRDCRESFFARMWRIYRDDPRFCGRLRTQYRMHPDIAAFVNRFAYGGGLHNGRPPVSEVPRALRDDCYVALLASRRLGFCHAPQSSQCTPKSSRTEAVHVAGFVRALCVGFGLAPEDIGVIVAFRNQIAMVRSEIAAQGILTPEALDRVEIDTVERFQGSEKRAVLYTVAASTEGHLAFLRDACRDVPPEGIASEDGPSAVDCKLNVAVTRAREWFVLIGDRTLLTRVDSYRRLIEWCDALVPDEP